MKMKKKIKQGSALAFALVLAVPAAAYRADAAISIDTDRECSIKFTLDGSFQELKSMEIPVEVYRVAEVNSAGEYKELPGFESLDLGNISSQTTAREWEEKAGLAVKAAEEGQISPEQTSTTEEGFTGLETGMYLVEAQAVSSEEYDYGFTPYLLALPNNYYTVENPDDSWAYDVTAGLKPEQTPRFGGIQIRKTLDSYNETLGSASFIFSVEAVKDGETVYSDVVSLIFDAPGIRTLTVEDIPAGAQVTVTEIYSGASYQVTGSQTQTVTVESSRENTVSFTNEYNGENQGGTSIVNHFDYTEPGQEGGDGKWTPEQQEDSSHVQESADVQG